MQNTQIGTKTFDIKNESLIYDENYSKLPDKKVPFEPNLFAFHNYFSRVFDKVTLPQILTINPSYYIFKKFISGIYFMYIYDLNSIYNFAYIPQHIIKKFNLKINITRDINQLKYFNYKEDFELEPIPGAIESNTKYIKSIKNKLIHKISTQQYILKNISRWIVLDKNNHSNILGIYKTKSNIPDSDNIIQEVTAKPKIIIRTFVNKKTNVFLAQISRYLYDIDSLQFINHNNRYEFIRFVSTVYIEITK